MKNLVVLLVALLLVQAALAKKGKKSSSSSSSEENKKSKKDPPIITCPDCPKSQIVVAKEVTICEKEDRQIRCPPGYAIRILESFYGRRDNLTCPNAKMNNLKCSASNALSITKTRCDGTQECNLASASSWFADPCRDTYKYLEVTWLCDPKSSRY